MNLIDVLFWLLIALMGGVGWAVEAGLGQRHRAALASCVMASLGAGVFIMFWIDDHTSIQYEKLGPWVKKAKSKDQGGFDVVVEEDNSKSKSKDGSSGAASAAGKDADGSAVVDMKREVYNRTPFKDCPECPDVVILPEGSYSAGSNPDEPGRTPEELPRTKVTIAKPFAIGRVELLRGEFEAFATQTSYVSATQCDLGKRRGQFNWHKPGFEQDFRHPVTCLSQEDVERYLRWLSTKTGREYRLPTEQEWEYAARANTDTPYWTGDTLLRHQGNFGRSRDGTTPAGSFEMNDFGLADMAGSLWEMTSNCKKPPAADAPAPGTPPPVCERLIKGGGWNSSLASARHAARQWQSDSSVYNFIGIRVVRAVDERDVDKVLTREQRIALAKEEKLATDLRTKEVADTDKSKRDAREAAGKAAEISKFTADTKAAARQAAAEAKAKAELEAFNKKNAPPAKK